MIEAKKTIQKSNTEQQAGRNTLGQYRTLKIGGLSPVSPGEYCPLCSSRLEKERYGRDYIVRGCKKCSKTYYYMYDSHTLIELAFSYEDFFGDVKNDY